MGSLGDGDDEVKPIEDDPNVNIDLTETQPFDTQFSPPSFSGEKVEAGDADELQYLQSTLPFDDAVPAEDAFETQIMDLAGETQVMNIGGETQVLNDPDCIDNMETQLLDEFDNEVVSDSEGEGTDRTEVLEDGDEESDDEPVRRGSCQSVDGEKIQYTSVREHGEKGLMEWHDALTDKQNNAEVYVSTATHVVEGTLEPKPEPVGPRFASIRIASLRASALAARMASKGTNGGSCSVPSNNQSSELVAVKDNGVSFLRDSPKTWNVVDQEHDVGECNEKVKGLRNENKSRVGSRTARKLFAEDSQDDYGELPNNSNGAVEGEELLQLPACDGGLAGLSYVESQEPGELSQANAINFVDRFLKDNIVEFDPEVDHKQITRGNLNSVSSAKGPQSLAKKAKDRYLVGQAGVFDWDDSREDEGGGDIFCRRKEEFFESGSHERRSFTQPLKPGRSRLDEYRDREEHLNVHNKRMGLAYSDSKLVLHKPKMNDKTAQEMKLKRNLVDELDEHFNDNSFGGQSETNVTMTDVPATLNVGFDTQMAAEAMEALFNGEGVAYHDANDAHQVMEHKLKDSFKGSFREETNNVIRSKQPSSRKRVVLSDVGVASRQCKKAKNIGAKSSKESSISSEKHPKNVSKQSKMGLVIAKSKQSAPKLTANTNGYKIDAETCPRRRSQRNLSGQVNGSDNLNCPFEPSIKPKDIGQSVPKRKRSQREAKRTPVDSNMKRKTRSGDAPLYSKSADGKMISEDLIGVKAGKRSNRNGNASHLLSAKNSEVNARLDKSPSEKCKASDSACATPTAVNCKTPDNDASPVCMGNEYFNPSCKGNLSRLSLMKEIRSLTAAESDPDPEPEPSPASASRDLRKRRDMTDVLVLYSHHLDENIIKRQKKILARLGVSIASSITDATHFIADQFVRTKNMLGAIASGKPVVTHLWLESCGQASCFIDEKNYILRDAKKEKELGFSMPVSLARAWQRPLLKARRVLVTPNTKPGKEIISTLVKAVQGQVVERIGRSTLKEDKIPDNLLILSCEEDFPICVAFLEKGAAVYSSELLLNGIVTQKLEYERHRLFADKVKRTRSTIWLRKDGNQFLPVIKHK